MIQDLMAINQTGKVIMTSVTEGISSTQIMYVATLSSNDQSCKMSVAQKRTRYVPDASAVTLYMSLLIAGPR
jgi:hypothetical protein